MPGRFLLSSAHTKRPKSTHPFIPGSQRMLLTRVQFAVQVVRTSPELMRRLASSIRIRSPGGGNDARFSVEPTDAFGASPVPLVGRRTFPGASAKRRFDVMTAATTVLMRLSLKLFAETISNGRRKPGPDPVGSGREAHHISPRRTTACLGRVCDAGARRTRHRVMSLLGRGRRSRSVGTLSSRPGVYRQVPQALWSKAHFEKLPSVQRVARLNEKRDREWRLPFSCDKYNSGYTSVKCSQTGSSRSHLLARG